MATYFVVQTDESAAAGDLEDVHFYVGIYGVCVCARARARAGFHSCCADAMMCRADLPKQCFLCPGALLCGALWLKMFSLVLAAMKPTNETYNDYTGVSANLFLQWNAVSFASGVVPRLLMLAVASLSVALVSS